MKSMVYRSLEKAPRSRTMPIAGAACAALALFFISCSSIHPARPTAGPGDEGFIPPRYSIVCIIHGDGGYLYHDTGGKAHRADEVTLAKAKKVAEENMQAEVFIFHERQRRHFMFFFPRRDGTFYYYRNGLLIAEESYWRDKGDWRFDPEMELYDRFRADRFRAEGSPDPLSIFMYFGHEIPEFGGTGYDASYSNRTFTIDDLSEGMKYITRDSTKFDLVVLSTCFSGTPHTIDALSPHARYVIASPDNLHLSYFDLSPFERLDIALRDGDISGFAKTFARYAFDRLTEELQTAVTVVVYDIELVRPFVRSVAAVYDRTLNALNGKTAGAIERCDCADDPEYALPGIDEGVTVLYRSPRFGRSKNKESHSGWQCWKLEK